MDDRSRSILLQVAFKGAIELKEPTVPRITDLYEMLIELHDKLGINPQTAAKRSGGGSFSGGSQTTKGMQPTGETFMLEGALYTDFRAVKADPTKNINPKFPDFKRESDNQGFWLYTQDGEVVEDTAKLVAAADTKVY